MLFVPGKEPDRAIDPGTGIPAGIGLVRVAGDHKELIFALYEPWIQVDIKICIAIRAESGFLTVDPDFRIMIDALEFQRKLLFTKRLRKDKRLPVFVIPALEISNIAFPKA